MLLPAPQRQTGAVRCGVAVSLVAPIVSFSAIHCLNTLTIQVRTETSPAGESYESADILVDGLRLVDLLREIERPFAEREGHSKMAGGYAPLSAEMLLLPSRHLLGEPEPLFDYDGKVSVLECECGCPGCWPFVVRISVTDSTITWSDFEQPHRGPKAVAGHWTYEALPPFVFDREQYLAAISRGGRRS